MRKLKLIGTDVRTRIHQMFNKKDHIQIEMRRDVHVSKILPSFLIYLIYLIKSYL